MSVVTSLLGSGARSLMIKVDIIVLIMLSDLKQLYYLLFQHCVGKYNILMSSSLLSCSHVNKVKRFHLTNTFIYSMYCICTAPFMRKNYNSENVLILKGANRQCPMPCGNEVIGQHVGLGFSVCEALV